jgi:hypothetical protein
VDRGVQVVGSVFERLPVAGRAEPLVLFEVDEFVAERRLPLLAVERAERTPGERDGGGEGATLGDASVGGFGLLPVDRGSDFRLGDLRSHDRRSAALSARRDFPLDGVEAHVDEPVSSDRPAVVLRPRYQVVVGIDVLVGSPDSGFVSGPVSRRRHCRTVGGRRLQTLGGPSNTRRVTE